MTNDLKAILDPKNERERWMRRNHIRDCAGMDIEPENEAIRRHANRLIDNLYDMAENCKDKSRCDKYDIEDTPLINWGDLSCVSVSKLNDGWLAMIEEACPYQCQSLCDYIEKYLAKFGWNNVTVKTEW